MTKKPEGVHEPSPEGIEPNEPKFMGVPLSQVRKEQEGIRSLEQRIASLPPEIQLDSFLIPNEFSSGIRTGGSTHGYDNLHEKEYFEQKGLGKFALPTLLIEFNDGTCVALTSKKLKTEEQEQAVMLALEESNKRPDLIKTAEISWYLLSFV